MKKILLILSLGIVLWFIPWVFVLHLGVAAYFPYHPDGSRFLRVTGPVVGALTGSGWTKSENIPKSCKNALVAAEDGHFYTHRGVDPKGIKNAWQKNRKKGKIRAGGSTITQQTVKNIFLSRTRSYLRKSRELVGAILLDLTMSKDKQLTWYLNAVEFGPDLYGIENAALYYFKRKPEKLSFDQCVSLVSLLPDPKRSGPALKNNPQNSRTRARYRQIVRTMHKSGKVPKNSMASMENNFLEDVIVP